MWDTNKTILFIFLSFSSIQANAFSLGSPNPGSGGGGGGNSGGGSNPGGGNNSSSSSSSSTSSSSSRSSSSVSSSSSSSSPVQTGDAVNDISAIAQASSCKNYSWKNRGKAPSAYMNGMAITFAKSLCRQRKGESGGTLLSGKSSGNPDKDAVTWFEPEFDALNMNIDSSGPETLKSLYALGIGLGMRESSGKHCTGWDTTVTDQKAETAEAGLFQTSQNSINSSTELKKIYDEYKAGNSKCHLEVFSKNVTCKEQSIVGTGKGAEFQTLLKACPSLAAEYAMITLRIIRKHYGPINRKEAEIRSECRNMLDDVQEYVERNPSSVCSEV